jgi:hypothetical protein
MTYTLTLTLPKPAYDSLVTLAKLSYEGDITAALVDCINAGTVWQETMLAALELASRQRGTTLADEARRHALESLVEQNQPFVAALQEVA